LPPPSTAIIEEADDIAGEIESKDVLNAGLTAAAQAVEHYEIARYGTLCAWAKQLGRSDTASVLQKKSGRGRKPRTRSSRSSPSRALISRPRS